MSENKTPMKTLNGFPFVDQEARDAAQQNAEAVERVAEELAKKDKPLVYIDGVIPTTKDNVLATMTVKSKWLNIFAYIKIKCQGTSSMSYPKKNFTVTLYQDEARKIPLYITIPGWKHPSNKFVLKANYIDHLHARNIISARLWSEIVASRPDYDTLPEEFRNSPNNGAVDGFPIIVTTNGSYQGVYTWNIGKDAWLWGMNEDNPDHILLCAETNTDDEVIDTPCNFRMLWNGVNEQDWSIEVGENSESVKTALNALISCVKDTDDATFKATIGDHLDLRSAIDYWIYQYVICGIDGLAKNMLLGKYSEKKWICGAYDLDSTFGLWWTGASFVSAMTKCPEGYQEKRSLLWERISALYADEVKARYAELRESVLSYANITHLFEEFYKQIGRDAYADDLIPYPEIPSAEANNIWQIRNFVRDRLNYADKKIVSGVPEEYEQIVYIDATGTQYIDTGVSGGANAEYEIKFSALQPQVRAYEQFFFGDKTPSIPSLFYNNANAESMGITSKDSGGVTKISTWDANGRNRDVIVRYESDGNIYVDKSLFTKRETAGNGWGESTWYVANSHGEPTLTAHMRIYYVKMWTDGVLVRDFVPAINTTSNAAGLYDRVTGEFFTNAGTGEFVTPA